MHPLPQHVQKLFHSLVGPHAMLVYASKSEPPEVATPHGVTQRGNRHVSDPRYAPPATVAVPTTAAHAVGRSPSVGYVPARTNTVRDGVAIALLVLALLLPWNLDFGLGVPGSNGLLFGLVAVVTLLALAAPLAPHVRPLRRTAPH